MIGGSELILLVASVVLLAGVLVGVIVLAIWLVNRTGKPSQSSPAAGTVRLATCPRCGTPLPPDAPQGLCPRCVFQIGIETQDAAEPAFQDAAGRPNAPDPAALADSFPQLEILELLGQGGMGAVYKARQKDLDRLVALKVLPGGAGRDPAFAERFMREARALARLSHPNIVAVYDFGRAHRVLPAKSGTEGSAGEVRSDPHTLYYFIMEFIDGPNLRQLMQSRTLTPREAMSIVPEICAALQFAHDEGIVHRDIKPENILVDKKGHVKIADFGIAKIVSKRGDFSLTGAKDVIGTPHYMAPEQVEHPTEVDHRADIYSLGVVFYEMLTGELPLGKFAVPSRKVNVDVRLDEVVLHALEKEPERRYQRANEVKTDVETIAGGAGKAEVRTQIAEENQGRRVSAASASSGVQPILAALLLAASVVAWALVGYWTYVQPLILERVASYGSPLSLGQRWLIEAGSLARHFGFLFIPMLVLLTAGSVIWLILSATRPVALSNRSQYPDRVRTWAARKAWGFGIASLCFVFGALIWAGRAFRVFVLGANTVGWQRLHGWGEWDLVIVFLHIVAAFGFGVASYRQWRVARGGELGWPAPPGSATESKAVLVARWTARVFGTLLLVFFGFFVLAEGLPPIASQPGGVQLNFVALGLMLGGFVVGWKREGTAALLIAAGWTLWQISENHLAWNLFVAPLAVAGLYAFCWWASSGRRTGVLAGAVVALATGLLLGRLFVPTNVFVQGIITDSESGKPVAEAELRLARRAAGQGDNGPAANARSDDGGRFRLYVGWYREGQPVILTAPGHAALKTNLGPRALGQRRLKRNFQLSPITTSQSSEGRAQVTAAQGGLVVHQVSNGLWRAIATFHNHGNTASPPFNVLFYAGAPDRGGRLISRNLAGPVPPGRTLGEATLPFALGENETEIAAVIDPENVLKRPADSREWILNAAPNPSQTVGQIIDEIFGELKGLKSMAPDRQYRLEARGQQLTGANDDFLRRRTGPEILASGLSCGCGDYATAFISLAQKRGLETLWVEGAELSSASLKTRFSGHVVVAVRDSTRNRWLLVDPTARSVISDNWSHDEKTFENDYWIGFVGALTNYPVHSPAALREFYDRTLKSIPAEELNHYITRFKFEVDSSLRGSDGSYLNPNLAQFLGMQDRILTKYGIHPEKEVAIRLIKGADDARSTLSHSEEGGWVCTVGLQSACSPGFLSYLEREVARQRMTPNATTRTAGAMAAPPVVISTVPDSGTSDVDPALTELRVTFSKDMLTDGMWSFSQISKETFPENAGQIHYLDDRRTCAMPVKLEPGKTYAVWINRGKFNSFRDTEDNPAIPYLLVFQTRE